MANPSFVYRPPMSPYLDIVYRDNDMVVAIKPSGLLSVPGKAVEHRDALITRINRVFPTATVVHRLDMATSGVMVLALNKDSHRHISKQFELRKTKKRYFARVYGHMTHDTGEVNLPLICDWPNRPKQKVDHENGKRAVTHFEVIERSKDESGHAFTLVALYPITGRSHQLRVHMLALGHPILGDRLYAHPKALAMAPRLQLHAESLSLTHPTDAQWLNFQSPIPFSHYQAASMATVPEEYE
ncbi:bifunctional tRNA pseudouridine(32) synthase/23S rRNA pseudouridine(746) synthase RluA [Alteromonas sp. D210916BOD_24]|uniref:bifunctional tRNA pseudouridine(32) synthase/23S rRNA pseudouridine(746) synthase RluA n=1 Tax=Alteromonas sp. D210916BOD_24 TaxID=3157618 RepID=UPI00399D2B44